jgi:hypothetical protein
MKKMFKEKKIWTHEGPSTKEKKWWAHEGFCIEKREKKKDSHVSK